MFLIDTTYEINRLMRWSELASRNYQPVKVSQYRSFSLIKDIFDIISPCLIWKVTNQAMKNTNTLGDVITFAVLATSV